MAILIRSTRKHGPKPMVHLVADEHAAWCTYCQNSGFGGMEKVEGQVHYKDLCKLCFDNHCFDGVGPFDVPLKDVEIVTG